MADTDIGHEGMHTAVACNLKSGPVDTRHMSVLGWHNKRLNSESCATQMSDSVIEALWEQWKHLGSLRLTNCKSLTDRALHRMAVLPSLYNIFLSGNQNFSHSLMSSVKQRIKLATFRQCGDLSVCVYGSLPSPGS